jgi:hypothetical protein
MLIGTHGSAFSAVGIEDQSGAIGLTRRAKMLAGSWRAHAGWGGQAR